MDIEKIPALLEEHSRRIEKLEKVFAGKDKTPELAELIEPRIVEGNIFIPLLSRTIAVNHIENRERYSWNQAMDHCKEYGLELPSKKDVLILLWQFDKINALLRSLGKPEISPESWFWTKTENSSICAWLWYRRNSNYAYSYKEHSNALMPFFAID